MKNNENRRFTLGLIFVAIGLIILFNNLNFFDIGDFISTYWPLLLVIWGVTYLLKSKDETDEPELIPVTSAGPVGGEKEETKNKSNPNSIHKLIGDIVVRPQGTPIRSGSYSVLIGEIFLDLSGAEMPKEPVKLYLNATIGSVRVMINQKHAFKISANALAGDINIVENKDSGIQARMFWENNNAGNLIEIQLNTLLGDVIVW